MTVSAQTPLVADLSSSQIEITTSFTGTNLLLFGSTEGAGDVVVIVRGPKRREIVRRKERIAGIWINRYSVGFESVPGYYFEASTRPLLDFAPEKTLQKLQIGTARLHLPAVAGTSEADERDYRQALLRLKKNQNLYSSSTSPISIIGGRLFRVPLSFPANVPTGEYSAEIYLFQDGKTVSAQRKTLAVRKAGIEAVIFNFAHEQSAIYGILAVIIALFAGWIAGVIFKKV